MPRFELKSADEYLAIAVQRLRNPTEPETAAGIGAIALGIFLFVVFLIVALLSRSWGFSFSGALLAIVLAGVGVWILVRPR